MSILFVNPMFYYVTEASNPNKANYAVSVYGNRYSFEDKNGKERAKPYYKIPCVKEELDNPEKLSVFANNVLDSKTGKQRTIFTSESYNLRDTDGEAVFVAIPFAGKVRDIDAVNCEVLRSTTVKCENSFDWTDADGKTRKFYKILYVVVKLDDDKEASITIKTSKLLKDATKMIMHSNTVYLDTKFFPVTKAASSLDSAIKAQTFYPDYAFANGEVVDADVTEKK